MAEMLASVARGKTQGKVKSAGGGRSASTDSGIEMRAGRSLMARVARGGNLTVSSDTVAGKAPLGDGTLAQRLRAADDSAPTTHVGSGIHGATVSGLRMAPKVG